MYTPRRGEGTRRPRTSGGIGLGGGTPSSSGFFRESTRGRTPRHSNSSRKPRLQLEDDGEDGEDTFEDDPSTVKELERLASETRDLLFYSKFLEKEVSRETILEDAKLKGRRPPQPRGPAHPPADQRTVSWTRGPAPLSMTAHPIAEGTGGRANRMNQLSAAWYRSGRAELARKNDEMYAAMLKLQDMSLKNDTNDTDPDATPEALAEAETRYRELELATKRTREAYNELYDSLQMRRFKVTPMPQIAASYRPPEPYVPGRSLPSRLGDAYVAPPQPTPPPPTPSPAPTYVTDGTDLSDANDLVHELWTASDLAEEPGRPSARGTGATAARERRRRAAKMALEEAASGRPSPFVVSSSTAEISELLQSSKAPPSPMTMERAKNFQNISTLGVPRKNNTLHTPKESTALISGRRLAEVTRRRDAAAVADAQAKKDTTKAVSLPLKNEKTKSSGGLTSNVSQFRNSLTEDQPPEPPPPKVVTSRTRESAVPYEPRGPVPEGFKTMGGGTVLPGPKPFKGGGTGGLFGDYRDGEGSGGGRRFSARRSVSSSGNRRGGSEKVEDETSVVEAKARVQTSATMSLMENNLAPEVKRSKLVDPMQTKFLSRHVDGEVLSLAGGNWTLDKGRALGAVLHPGITTLTLADNSIDEKGAEVLAEFFANPLGARISTLDLSSCRLTDRTMAIFAPALAVAAIASARKQGDGKRAHVKTLSLACNPALGDNGIRALTFVGPSTVLADINLSRCGITASGAVTVSEMINDVATLERLTLSWNNIGGGGGSGPLALRRAIEENTRLKSLDMGHCSLGRVGAAHIIRATGSYHGKIIEELFLQGNGLEVDSAEDIASIIVKGTGLKFLDVSGNAIGLDGATALISAAETSGGAAKGSPIKLNLNGCSLRHDPRTYPAPPPPVDPALKDSEGAGAGKKTGGGKGGKGDRGAAKPAGKSAHKRVAAQAPVLPKEIIPGLYRCDLADPAGRAAAVMLCLTREVQGSQAWRRVTLDGAPVCERTVAMWPEALPPPNEPKDENAPLPTGPWLEVDIGAAAAAVAVGPQGCEKMTAMTAERFMALWRGVARDPTGAPSSQWLCDYVRALANAGFFFTAEQVAEIIEEVRFSSARVEAAVALWPRVVDPEALTIVEARLGVGACRAVRGRLNASHALRLANPTGRYHLHMSRAHDRSVAARLIALYAEESAASKAGTFKIRSRLLTHGTHVGDAAVSCVRSAWVNVNGGKLPAEVGDVQSGGGDITAAAAQSWNAPTDGMLTIDFVSHAKRVPRDAGVMPPAAFEELIVRLTRATTIDPATVAAAMAVALSPVAPTEGGAKGVEGYAVQQAVAISAVAESEIKARRATSTEASSGEEIQDDVRDAAPQSQGEIATAPSSAAAVEHSPLAGSWLAGATVVADGTAFLVSAGEGRTLTSEEVTAWHTRLGFAATLATAETAAAAAAASGAEPPDLSGCITEADILNLLRCHELQPGAELVRQFDPVALVPVAVMDNSPEGLLVELAGDTLEAELSALPPAFMLRPGDLVDATPFLMPGGAFEEHHHPATLRAPREGEVQPPPGGKKAPPPESPPQKKKGKIFEEPPPPPACVVLVSTSKALHALRAERPAAFDSLCKAISGVKSSFPLGRGAPAPKPPKQAAAKKNKGKKASPADIEAERVAAIEAKVNALAAAAEAAGPNATGMAAAQEVLREIAALYAFTSAQVRQMLLRVPWSSAMAAEDVAVTLFCRTVDPEAGFAAALRVLPAASQMRVCQRLGWLNVFTLSDADMHFRLRLWRADELLALKSLLRMSHTCATDVKCYRRLEPGDEPYQPPRSPPPGWRGVSLVPADGGSGGAEGRLTLIPTEQSTPSELSALFKKALSGDVAAQRVTVHFRFDITAEETRICAARWIQGAVRGWFTRRMFNKKKAAVIRLQVMWRAKRLRGNIWIWGLSAQSSRMKGWRTRARKAAEERAKIIEVTVVKEKGKTSYYHHNLL